MPSWRDQFHEDNKLLLDLLRGPFGKLYGIGALLTFFRQLLYRLDHCSDASECALSLLKGVAWSMAWPLWWAMWATDFILVHAFLGK
jgi:hypothetical protein